MDPVTGQITRILVSMFNLRFIIITFYLIHLQEDLMIDIGVKYLLKDQTTPSKLHTIHVNLGLPLVAVLKLWKPIENEAMEHEDFSDKNSYS